MTISPYKMDFQISLQDGTENLYPIGFFMKKKHEVVSFY